MKNLFILTNQAGNIPQKILESDSVSAKMIRDYFTNYDFNVKIFTYDEFLTAYNNLSDEIKGSYFFYASSQYPEYYSAIEDILLLIKEKGGILIPGFIHFRAHENKFLQEIVKTDLNIKCPRSWQIGFPAVAKLSSGYGSKTVSLLKTKDEGITFLEKNLIPVVTKRKNFLKYRKQVKDIKGNHPLKVGKIILQEYIDGIENDWKILVFGDRIFYLKRYFRDNDFRASGSGNFDSNIHPDKDILEFAMKVRMLLNTPWVSLDIIKRGSDIYLIEYQCVHFGLYTVMKSTEHYVYRDGIMEVVKAKVDEDVLFAEELHKYILSDEE